MWKDNEKEEDVKEEETKEMLQKKKKAQCREGKHEIWYRRKKYYMMQEKTIKKDNLKNTYKTKKIEKL